MTMEEPKQIIEVDLEQLEEDFIKSVEEKGPEDLATREILEQWTLAQEKKVKEFENTEEYIEAQIMLNIERGRLYFKAGGYASAWQAFEDARQNAFREGRDDLFKAIEKEMDELGI